MHFQLGILGGMGPWATAKIFEKIVCLTDAKNDSEHISILISCNPTTPDRTVAICNKGDSPLPELYKGIDFLNTMRVEAIIVPCNTCHFYFEELSARSEVPIINMVSETMQYVEKKYPDKNICVLATEGTLEARVYETNSHIHTKFISLDESQRFTLMRIIYDIKAGGNIFENYESLAALIYDIGNEDTVFVIACTELSILFDFLKEDKEILSVDAGEVLAFSAIMKLGYRVRNDLLNLDTNVFKSEYF